VRKCGDKQFDGWETMMSDARQLRLGVERTRLGSIVEVILGEGEQLREKLIVLPSGACPGAPSASSCAGSGADPRAVETHQAGGPTLRTIFLVLRQSSGGAYWLAAGPACM
jgi:hypothetical protein